MAAKLIGAFAGCFLLLTWLIYPLGLLLLQKRRKAIPVPGRASPPQAATVLVTVWNAENEIAERVRNLASQTYPPQSLKILVASDGSTDGTVPNAASAAPGRVLAKQFPRAGKSATQNAAIPEIIDEIVVLTDAETSFEPDCIEHLLIPFADPEVGCVTGKMISVDAARPLSSVDAARPLSKDQGLYWRFENRLRSCESDAGILVTTAGPSMAFRRKLFVPLAPSQGDDCMIPLDVALAGYRVVFEPRAIAYDTFPSTIRGELRARRRMVSRNLSGILARPQLLNPFHHPGYASSLWLHKILRWLTPFFAVALFVASITMLNPWLLAPQLAFLLLAALGGFYAITGKTAPRLASAAFSFLIANIGFASGVIRWATGEKITTYSNIRDRAPGAQP